MGDAFRSEEIFNKYQARKNSGIMKKRCFLCDETPIKSFKYWKIIPNEFPYDLIAETHHMIIPLRHVDEAGLTAEELSEYKEIKAKKLHEYAYIVETMNDKKSIPEHFHLHLINGRKDTR